MTYFLHPEPILTHQTVPLVPRHLTVSKIFKQLIHKCHKIVILFICSEIKNSLQAILASNFVLFALTFKRAYRRTTNSIKLKIGLQVGQSMNFKGMNNIQGKSVLA
jgi:hypothetical protein